MKIQGMPRYIARNVKFDDFDKITLSERVVISGQVRFLTHDYSITTAFIAKGENIKKDIAKVKPITIEENVFIGARSFILPGTRVGKNSIIGAGSVIRGRIPERSVVIGNPAKIICTIDELAERWSNLNEKELRKD